jgi:hypothetical protein
VVVEVSLEYHVSIVSPRRACKYARFMKYAPPKS